MDKRVFADFHGTWDIHPEIWDQVDAIITGKSWQNYNQFMDNWVGPKRPVFFNPVDDLDLSTLSIASHKANIINKCKVSKFFENNSKQVEMLKILCPGVEIVLVKEEYTYI